MACVGVAAWDVGHDWILAQVHHSVMALASFGLVPQLLYYTSATRCVQYFTYGFIVFHGFLLYEYNVKKYCVQSFFNVLS